MPRDDRPFLSLLAWPTDLDRATLAQFLAESLGLDRPTVQLSLGQEPPMVVGQGDPAAVRDVVRAVSSSGGDAFACTYRELERIGAALPLWDLTIRHGAFEVVLDDRAAPGMKATIPRERIQVLVRATLVDKKVTYRQERIQSTPNSMGMTISVPEHSVDTRERLDIHTTDGTLYRIDAKRFQFSALGDLRQRSRRADMDALCELVEHVAPNEIVDQFFKIWNPPARHQHLRVPGVREDLDFEFYTRWVALMYRHLMC